MNFPDDLKYHKEHLWARIEGSTATIGVSDYAQNQLGEVVYLELPDEGDEVTQGESFGEIESAKAVSDLISPLSGRIVEVNYAIVDEPYNINSDPYESGWLIKIELANQEEEVALLDAASYSTYIQ